MKRVVARFIARPWLVAAAVFVVAAVAAAALVHDFERQRLALLRTDIEALAAGLGRALEREIDHTATAAVVLGALVREAGGALDDFPRVAAELFPYYPSAAYLHLSPGAVVRGLYPLPGNEAVLGLDLLNDPERAPAAALARDTGRLTLGGPYRLIQGGLGIAARQPVFLPDPAGERFWGFATVVMRMPEVIERVGFARLSAQGLGYRLTQQAPQPADSVVIAAATDGPTDAPAEPVLVTLAVPNGTWTLALAPATGWGDPLGLGLRAAVGLGFSLLLGALAWLLMRARGERAALAQSLALRTGELQLREAELHRAEAVAQVGLWEFDILADRATLSPVGARITGLPLATAFDLQRFIEHVHPDDRERVAAAWSAALDGAPYDVEHRSIIDGEVRWFRQRAVLDLGPDGTPRRATGTVEDITPRRLAQDALRRSEARLRGLLETAHEGIWLLDPDGRTQFANARLGELLGQPAAALIGRSFMDFVDPEWRAVALDNLDRRNRGIAEVHEFRFTRPDGTAVWTLISTNPVFGEDGRIEGALAMLADISARKRAEQALERERQLLMQAERLASIGAWELDLDSGQVRVSPGWCAIHGVGDVAPTSADETLPLADPADHAAVERALRDAVAGVAGYEVRHRIRRRNDAAERWVHGVGELARDAEGRPVRLFGVTQDVTAEVTALAELRIAAIAFEAQEGLLVMDAHERILRVNRAFAAITGYSTADAVGQSPRRLVSERHDGAFFAALWAAVAAHQHWEGEVWHRRKDGGVFPAWMTITAVRDEQGLVTHYVGTLTDISANKAAEEAIRQLAFYDPLTQLPNRRLLQDRLRQTLAAAARSGQYGALIFIDLDRFKDLNDSRGHQVGDQLLEAVALRLVSAVRATDTVARFGGDEFVVLLANLGRDPQLAAVLAESIARKALTALGVPYQIAGQTHDSTPSLGVALFDGRIKDADEVLRRADLAMYQAKAAGRNRVCFYSDQPAAADPRRAAS